MIMETREHITKRRFQAIRGDANVTHGASEVSRLQGYLRLLKTLCGTACITNAIGVYLGDAALPEPCGHCCNCLPPPFQAISVDASDLAIAVLEAVVAIQNARNGQLLLTNVQLADILLKLEPLQVADVQLKIVRRSIQRDAEQVEESEGRITTSLKSGGVVSGSNATDAG